MPTTNVESIAKKLSTTQRNAILSRAGYRIGKIVEVRTWRALRGKALVEFRYNGTGGWHLTDLGRQVADVLRAAAQ